MYLAFFLTFADWFEIELRLQVSDTGWLVWRVPEWVYLNNNKARCRSDWWHVHTFTNTNYGVEVYLSAELDPGMVGLAPKWVRLDPKLDKSGTFSDQISVHLAHLAEIFYVFFDAWAVDFDSFSILLIIKLIESGVKR